jgi:hypothetical protein
MGRESTASGESEADRLGTEEIVNRNNTRLEEEEKQKKIRKAITALNNILKRNEGITEEQKEGSTEFENIAQMYLDELLSGEEPDIKKEEEILSKGMEYLSETGNGDTEIVEIKCTRRLCKIVMVHKNELALQEFHRKAVDFGPWEGTQFGQLDISMDGRYMTRIYFFGKEEKFPIEGYRKYKEGRI